MIELKHLTQKNGKKHGKMEFTHPRLNAPKKGRDWYVWWRVREEGEKYWKVMKVRASINRFKTVKERKEFGIRLCEKVLRDLENNVSLEAGHGEVKHISVVLSELVNNRKAALRHRSWQSYHYAVSRFIRFLQKHHPRAGLMSAVSRSIARGFIESLYIEGLKGRSINNIRDILSILFNRWIETTETPRVNPFRGITKAQKEIGRNLAFTDYQKRELWERMDVRLHLFTRFIFFCYIRPLELLRLRVSDVRLDTGEIIIGSHQSKNKRQQSVVIPDVFLKEVKAMGLSELPQDWYLFGKGLKPGTVSYGRNSVTARHTKILRALGYSKDFTLYSWKHTGVVAAYRAEVDLYNIMRQLRHHSLDQTLIYLKSLGLVRNTEFAGKMVG